MGGYMSKSDGTNGDVVVGARIRPMGSQYVPYSSMRNYHLIQVQ
jgi:hypothetical protein